MTMPIINNSTEIFSYKEIDITIPANGQYDYQNPYNFLRLLSSTGTNDDLMFRFGSSSLETSLSVGIGLKFENFLASVTIRNKTNAPVTIKISEIYGNVTDDRLVLSGIVNTEEVAFKNFNQEELTFDGNGEAVVDSTGYKSVIIQNVSTTSKIYIGDSNGLEIDQGGSFEKNLSKSFTVYGTAGQKIKVGYFS